MSRIFLNWLTLTLCFLVTSCEQTQNTDNLIGNWNVESVIKLSDNQKATDMGSTFEFRKDGELIANDIVLGERRGTWQLAGKELLLIQGNDSTLVNIAELSNSELTWKADLGEGDLLFTLNKEESR